MWRSASWRSVPASLMCTTPTAFLPLQQMVRNQRRGSVATPRVRTTAALGHSSLCAARLSAVLVEKDLQSDPRQVSRVFRMS
eukprot:1255662-Amphidinium_carterae.1